MKKYGPEEFTEFAFAVLERALDEYPESVTVYYTPKHPDLDDGIDRLSYIEVSEYGPRRKEQEWIKIAPTKNKPPIHDENGMVKDVKAMVAELKNHRPLLIQVNVKILKAISKGKYVVRLFDKLFILETSFNMKYDIDPSINYEHFVVRNDEIPTLPGNSQEHYTRFFEADKKDILAVAL